VRCVDQPTSFGRLAVAVALRRGGGAPWKALAGDDRPDFELKDVQGKVFRLWSQGTVRSSTLDDLVRPLPREIPMFKDLHATYGARDSRSSASGDGRRGARQGEAVVDGRRI